MSPRIPEKGTSGSSVSSALSRLGGESSSSEPEAPFLSPEAQKLWKEARKTYSTDQQVRIMAAVEKVTSDLLTIVKDDTTGPEKQKCVDRIEKIIHALGGPRKEEGKEPATPDEASEPDSSGPRP